MVKIKNKGTNPLYIGKTICQGHGAVTPVVDEELSAYLKTPGGSSLYSAGTLLIFDDDFERKQKAEKMAVRAAAIAEAKKEIEPEIRKEVEEEMEKKYSAVISGLQKKIETVSEKSAKQDKKPESDESDESDQSFSFDPEKHMVEHRGAGKWFVMDGEKKVYGPITTEEREKFESMIGE